METIKLYKPRDYQAKIHRWIDDHIKIQKRRSVDFKKIITILAPRRTGKSFLVCWELIRFSLHYKKSQNIYVAPDSSDCDEIFDKILDFVPNMIKKSSRIKHRIEFLNGSKIKMYSTGKGNRLRGKGADGLIVIDEAAFIKDDIYEQLIKPWADDNKSLTIMVSTPKYKFGFYYDNYMKGLTDSKWNKSFSFNDFDLSQTRSAEELEEIRTSVSRQTFKSEYLGLFLDADGEVFGNFEECLIDELGEFKNVTIGLDWANGVGKDYTVLVGFNDKNELCYLWYVNDMEPTEQVKFISEFYKQNKAEIREFIAEDNSIGQIYKSYLKQAGVTFKSIATTNQRKRKLVEKFKVLLEQKKIKLIKNNDLITQLSFYEEEVDPKTGKITYNAKKGFNDDIVMALMIAAEAANKTKIQVKIL